MVLDKNISHKEIVFLWEKENAKNLECKEFIKLFAGALLNLEKRCFATLSNVTVQVVIDRVLHEGHEKYPILNLIKLEPSGLNFEELNQNCEKYKAQELKEALSYLLVELLTVIGNITSDVLTAPLHKKLMEVTSASILTETKEEQNERQ